MLTYQMVRKLFPSARGVADDEMVFHSVFVHPYQQVEKGLFVPLADGKTELKLAIEHGAIATLWPEQTELPRYVPNPLPVFFVSSPFEALKAILQTYMESNRVENDTMTKFYLTIDVPHRIAENHTYDIALMNELQQLEQKWFSVQRKEGSEPSW
ncbi:hypothetical protein [Anoxybacillus sp. J5B_2022]|uniref:hypothetical protein n=1 Tax=Anoxybacillus sp. J5B_2022 TaxID=3003246 RepID=UPI0022862684|nr:hypothetical protein [Anoxybacillus sp. J5B_2022]MCZ0755530.1 hypothetical protein [Anoxybacillus sp. J5B_2022]